MAKKSNLSRRITASKMTIRQHYSWPVKIAIFLFVIGLGSVLTKLAYELGRNFAFGPRFSPEQMTILEEKVIALTQERDKLANFTSTIESQQRIEKTVQTQLTEQINRLTVENNKIKDDLAFFESLMPSTSRPQGLTLQRVFIEQTEPRILRYRVLVMQGGKGVHDFSGELRINLTLIQNGKTVMMEFPNPKSVDPEKFKLTFKQYQRLDGQIDLPDNIIVQSAQIKVLEKGEVRVKQIVNL